MFLSLMLIVLVCCLYALIRLGLDLASISDIDGSFCKNRWDCSDEYDETGKGGE